MQTKLNEARLAEASTQVSNRLINWAESELAIGDSSSIEPTSLAGGYPGIALSILDYGLLVDDEDALGIANKLIAKVARISHRFPYDQPSLYSGTGGFLAIVSMFATTDDRYQRALSSLVPAYTSQILSQDLSRPWTTEFRHSSFDFLEGAAGQLSTICSVANQHPRHSDALRKAATHLTEYLLSVTEQDSHGRLGWLVAPSQYWNPEDTGWAPHGTYNLGFAHGVPGVLSAIAGAHQLDLPLSGIENRIRQLRDWISNASWDADGTGPGWPIQIPAAPSQAPISAPEASQQLARSAWCYGAPGVVSSLVKADAAIRDNASAELCGAAIKRIAETSWNKQSIFSPTLCHGFAGVATIATSCEDAMSTPTLNELKYDCIVQMLELGSVKDQFIFANRRAVPADREHDPGFLTGAAGVLLTINAAIRPSPLKWETLLLS